jgi:hypothetical protein
MIGVDSNSSEQAFKAIDLIVLPFNLPTGVAPEPIT